MEIPENQNSERAGIGSTTLFAISDIRQNIYDHGGCRIYFEQGDKRDLICDGYQDAAFSAALRKFVDDYFANVGDHSRPDVAHFVRSVATSTKCDTVGS